jgi:hypothetical protein
MTQVVSILNRPHPRTVTFKLTASALLVLILLQVMVKLWSQSRFKMVDVTLKIQKLCY